MLGKSANERTNKYIYIKARLTEGGMLVLKAIKVKVQVIYNDVVVILYFQFIFIFP